MTTIFKDYETIFRFCAVCAGVIVIACGGLVFAQRSGNDPNEYVNLLANSGIEDGRKHWHMKGDVTVCHTDDASPEGKSSMELQPDKDLPAELRSQIVDIRQAETLILRYSWKTLLGSFAGGKSGIYVKFFDKEKQLVSEKRFGLTVTDDTWKSFKFKIKVEKNAIAAEVCLKLVGDEKSGGTFLIDNIELLK